MCSWCIYCLVPESSQKFRATADTLLNAKIHHLLPKFEQRKPTVLGTPCSISLYVKVQGLQHGPEEMRVHGTVHAYRATSLHCARRAGLAAGTGTGTGTGGLVVGDD